MDDADIATFADLKNIVSVAKEIEDATKKQTALDGIKVIAEALTARVIGLDGK
jgi:hypothetical protein